jgi:hypothetical protein
MKKKAFFIKAVIGIGSFFFLVVLILSMSGYVPGYYEVGGGIIPVDPNASGTKLYCTLTISYTLANESKCHTDAGAAESFFLRIRKGNNHYAYGGNFPEDPEHQGYPICWDDIATQVQAISDFFKDVAMPELFPSNPNAPFAIKSYGNNIQGGGETGAPFGMIDLVIAVKE